MKRIVMWVQWTRGLRCWLVLDKHAGAAVTEDFDFKQEAISSAVRRCRALHEAGARVQLKVRNKNGRIAFERTYGDDPRRHRG